MQDPLTSLELGLARLFEHLDQDHARYIDALTLQSRLSENINAVRAYGDSELRRSDRAQIIANLNQLALETANLSFNELCAHAPQFEPDTFPVLDQSISNPLRKLIETESLVPIYQTSSSGQFILIGLVRR